MKTLRPPDSVLLSTRLERDEPNRWIDSGLGDGGGGAGWRVRRFAILLSRRGGGRNHDRETEAGDSLRES